MHSVCHKLLSADIKYCRHDNLLLFEQQYVTNNKRLDSIVITGGDNFVNGGNYDFIDIRVSVIKKAYAFVSEGDLDKKVNGDTLSHTLLFLFRLVITF